MYILKIGRSFPQKKTGMMGIFEFEQAEALSKYGHQVVYAFLDTRSIKRLRKYGYYQSMSSSVHNYGYHLPIGGIPQFMLSEIKLLYYKKILNKIIKKHGIPDIIHVHFPLLTLTEEIWDYFKEFKKPIVVTEHWSKVQVKDLEGFRMKLLERVTEESNQFICVGDLLKESVIDLTKTNKNIKVIPNMVNNNFFYESKNNSNSKFEFITIGRLVETKRFEFLIDVFTKVFSSNENVYLNIVGNGPLLNKLEQQINFLGMNKRIRLYGFLPRKEIAVLIRNNDAFVSASELETFGVPFIESLVSGKPIIGAKNGPIDRYISTDNGILFEKNNSEELKTALKFMYENKTNYDEKKIAYQATKLFSEESIVDKLNTIYYRYNR